MQHQQKQSWIPMCSSPIEHNELPYVCVGKPIEGSGADRQERQVVEEPQFITLRENFEISKNRNNKKTRSSVSTERNWGQGSSSSVNGNLSL